MSDSLTCGSVNTNKRAEGSLRSRKRRLGIGQFAAVGVAALALTLSACSSETESSTESATGPSVAGLMESGTITIGTKFDQPGFGFMNTETNEPEGFDVEIGKIIAASLGSSPEDLAGKNVCSVEGSTSAQNMQTDYPQAQLTLFDVYSKCLAALKNGQVDAVTTDNVILIGFVAQDPDAFEVVGKPFTSEPYGIGLKLEDSDFRNFINDALEASYADGSWVAAWEATAGKFMDTPAPPAVDRY